LTLKTNSGAASGGGNQEGRGK